MSLEIPFGIKVINPLPVESKYFNSSGIPYADTTEVTTEIPQSIRYQGLTVLVVDTEYWFKDGVTDGDLVVKSLGGGSSFSDSAFEIYGSSDPTKIAKFEVDGFTTATTRTFTLPDGDGTLARTSDLNGWLTGTLTGISSVNLNDSYLSLTKSTYTNTANLYGINASWGGAVSTGSTFRGIVSNIGGANLGGQRRAFESVINTGNKSSNTGLYLFIQGSPDFDAAYNQTGIDLTMTSSAGLGGSNTGAKIAISGGATTNTGLSLSVTGGSINRSLDVLAGAARFANQTLQIRRNLSDFVYTFASSNITADRTVTLPLLTGNDTFVFQSHSQTLTNKTLTSPIINYGSDAAGDLYRRNAGNTTQERLAKGAEGTILRAGASVPAYSTFTIPNTISALSTFVSNSANVLTEITPSAGQSIRVNAGGTAWEAYTPGSGGGDVTKVGTPVDNQVGVWTGDGTIEGTTGFTYDGSNLQLTGDIGSTGTRITKGWFTDLQVTNAIAGSITGNAATVTTNANLTGHITSTGNTTVLGSFTLAQLNTAISDANVEDIANKATSLATLNNDLYPTTQSLFQQRSVTGTDSIVAADNGKTIVFNSASPFNFTIDALTAGMQMALINKGTGTVTLVAGSGVTLGGVTTLATNESAAVIYYTSTSVDSLGGGGTALTNPMTTEGDLILGGSGGTPTRLGIGANTYVLTSNGTTASWAAPSGGGGGITIGSTSITGGTSGRLLTSGSTVGELTLGTGVSTWLTTPSWTNFQSAITGTSPYLLTSGDTYTTTTGNGLALTTSTLTSGNLVSLTSTGTAADSSTQTVLNIATSGANGTSGQYTYGAKISNTHTGTSSRNYGLQISVSGATENYALDVYGSGRFNGSGSEAIYLNSSVSSTAFIDMASSGTRRNRLLWTSTSPGYFETAGIGIGSVGTSGAGLSVAGGIVLQGSDRYLNFTSTHGSSGYGFRDNAGTMEFKNSGGSWAGFIGGSTGSVNEGIIVANGTGGYTIKAQEALILDAGSMGNARTTLQLGLSTTTGGYRNIVAEGADADIILDIWSKGESFVDLNSMFQVNSQDLVVSSSGERGQFIQTDYAGLRFDEFTANSRSVFKVSGFGITGVEDADLVVATRNLDTGGSPSGNLYLSVDVGTSHGNIGIGTEYVSNWQSMQRGMFIQNSVATPSAAIADGIALFSLDNSSETILGLRTEKAVATGVAVASTHKYMVSLNGTLYYILLEAV